MYIPEGYGTVFPYMLVDDANAFAAFLANVFDATEVGRTESPDGRVANLQIRIGSSKFMIAEPDKEMFKPMPAAYYVYVEDVDHALEKAIAHGATKLSDAMNMPYQDRQAGVTDPFGNMWWISKRLVEEPYDSE